MKPRALGPDFATLVQEFFCVRLIQQQDASARTVESYRDTLCLLLDYLQRVRKKRPTRVAMSDLDAPTVTAFLDHLEKGRHNTARTRNVRFAAIRSFMRYVSSRDPASLPIAQRVLAIPLKRFARPALTFLSREEVAAVLAAPDGSTWSGHRDRVLFALLYNTGARVSEAVALRRSDVSPDGTRSVRLSGKGRKQRTVPLWKGTAEQLRGWESRIGHAPNAYLFPNRRGGPLSRSGVEKRLRDAVAEAGERCPSLRGKKVSPHTLRHTTAMHLLHSGVDITVIALWLGHESTNTTHHYVEASLAMKDEALGKLPEPPQRTSGSERRTTCCGSWRDCEPEDYAPSIRNRLPRFKAHGRQLRMTVSSA
jgi:site-specific recombinase XerD